MRYFKSRSIVVSLLIAIIFFLFNSKLFSEELNITLKVVDRKSQQPLENVYITITNQDNGTSYEGYTDSFGEIGLSVIPTSINQKQEIRPDNFVLGTPYPQPTRNTSNVNFSLMKTADVTVSIYNVLGQRLFNYRTFLPSGNHLARLNLNSLPTGMYFMQLKTNNYAATRKIFKTTSNMSSTLPNIQVQTNSSSIRLNKISTESMITQVLSNLQILLDKEDYISTIKTITVLNDTTINIDLVQSESLTRFNNNRFPLRVGNSWTYFVTHKEEHLNENNEMVSDSLTATVNWEIEAEEEVFGFNTFKFKNTLNYLTGSRQGETGIMYTWYTQFGDTLRAVAFGSDDSEAFFTGTALFKGSSISRIFDIFPWDTNTLIFPIKIGSRWQFILNISDFRKIVEDAVDVVLPVGHFETFRIRFGQENETFNKNTGTTQWFSEIGLVKMYDQYESTIYNERTILELIQFTVQ